MATAKFTKAAQVEVQNAQKTEGQIILTYDSGRMFWDINSSVRIEITDIIELPNESARTGLVSPLDKFYYVLETNTLWRYHSGAWSKVGGGVAFAPIASEAAWNALKAAGLDIADTLYWWGV